VATSPSNRKRTKLGVGERVILKVDPGPGKWLVSGGTLSAGTGSTVTFIAGDRAGKGAVSVEVNGLKTSIEFQIIQPSEVHQVTVATKHDAVGQPNAGFLADIYVGPADVSFMNVSFLELEIMATDSGYWTHMTDKGHHPNSKFLSLSGTVVSGKGTKAAAQDNIFSGYPGVNTPPWEGTRTWNIPWQYKVGTGSAHALTTVTQSIVTTADGTTTASKAGASATFKLTDGAASY
jgi:hypothetical protein